MPRKHQPKSLLTKPTSSAPPSFSLSRPSSTHNHDSPQRTVNELIRNSRRAHTSEARPQEVQALSSIPPTLRAVLDLPIPAPPSPRYGVRGPVRLRRIPGPPPPRSWLTQSVHAPVSRNSDTFMVSKSARVIIQSSILPQITFPCHGSLQHSILKSMASKWDWHAEYDHEYLAELPSRMRELLLSYIAIYHCAAGPNPLHTLYPPTLEQAECDEVSRLDLGNAVGGWSTVKSIERDLFVTRKPLQAYAQKQDVAKSEVPEAWDDEEEDNAHDVTFSKCIVIPVSRFKNLKHISLAAVPGVSRSVASWKELLGLASKLPTITSLSLAYWPPPTYTPNASAGRFKVNAKAGGSSPTVLYGGSDFYTSFDNNWREAAGILRALSRSLYCLKWLDLTGCGEWLPALVWSPEGSDEDEEYGVGRIGPDWNRGWRSIEQLTLAVGWTPGPSPTKRSHAMDTTSIRDTADSHQDDIPVPTYREQALAQLSLLRLGGEPVTRTAHPEDWDAEYERDKYLHRKEIERHTSLQEGAREIARRLRTIRKDFGGKWIDVDFGQVETS